MKYGWVCGSAPIFLRKGIYMEVKLGEKNAKKIPVYIDGELLGALFPKEIDAYSLISEDEIGEEKYSEILEETLLPRAKRYVMNLLIKSDKTEAELKRKLRSALYGEEVSERAIEYVRGYHYIDELRTATAYIRTKMDSASEKEIRYKLEEKGIDDETIDMAYDRILEEMGDIENSELNAAIGFIKKRLGSRAGDTEEMPYEEKQKLMAAAYRKGFMAESIRMALSRLEE